MSANLISDSGFFDLFIYFFGCDSVFKIVVFTQIFIYDLFYLFIYFFFLVLPDLEKFFSENEKPYPLRKLFLGKNSVPLSPSLLSPGLLTPSFFLFLFIFYSSPTMALEKFWVI